MADNTKNDDKHDKDGAKANRNKGAKGKGGNRALRDRLPEGRDAVAIGAAVAGGIALVAALFAGSQRRKVPDDTGGQALDDDGANLVGGFSGASTSSDDPELARLGTPATKAVDDVTSYTGGSQPDMALNYVPGSDQDTGAAPAGATR